MGTGTWRTTPTQSMSALARANEVRFARAELKRKVTRGEITAAQVLLSPPPEAQGMEVYDLLICQRRWGRNRVVRLLSRHLIAETKALGGLTDRQRRLLARSLAGGGQVSVDRLGE